MTNRDKLNGMSNAELANFIVKKEEKCGICANSRYDEKYETYMCKSYRKTCNEYITEWLESEVE